MSQKDRSNFLFQIFRQCALDEQFYQNAKKIGVNFSNYPGYPIFNICHTFVKNEQNKGFQYASFSSISALEANSAASSRKDAAMVSLDEIKLFYGEYMSFIKAQELAVKLSSNPEKANDLCSAFLSNKQNLVKSYKLTEAVEIFVKNNEKKIKEKKFGVVLQGFENLSKIIDGFNPGRVTIVTAPTGFGKTNLAMNLFKSALKSGLNSVFINMEMDIDDLTKRFLQAQFKMVQSEFKHESYIQKITQDTSSWMANGQTSHFTDGSNLSLSEIDSLVSEIKRDQKLDIVFCDYDQKIVDDSQDAQEEWKFILKCVTRLEASAKRDNVHYVLFAQTDEDKEGIPRASKRAMQPAASVIYLYKYGNSTLLKFIKNRFGPTDQRIELDYLPEKSYIGEKGIFEEKPLSDDSKGRVQSGFKNNYQSRY